jgi:hypothetical protein
MIPEANPRPVTCGPIAALAGLICLLLLTSASAQDAQMSRFEQTGRRLAQNLARLEVTIPECESPRYGYAFVIGEDASDVFLFTPWHAVRNCVNDGKVRDAPTAMTVTFSGPDDEEYRVPAVLAGGKAEHDIAFLRVARPPSWRSVHPNLAQRFVPGTPVGVVGDGDRPIVLPALGRVLHECDPQILGGVCAILIDSLRSVHGMSGAVIFEQQGQVLGFDIGPRRPTQLVGVRADKVLELARSLRIPTTLYTAQEEAGLGRQLILAIEANNAAEIVRLLARRFNLDREYRYSDDFSADRPINVAARKARFDLVAQMMKQGAQGANGAVSIALGSNRLDLLDLLIARKLDAKCILAFALEKDRTVAAQRILEANLAGVTYDIDEFCDQRTALFNAIVNQHPALALQILKQGADPNLGQVDLQNPKNVKGRPLTAAILARQAEVVDRLLANSNIKVDVVDEVSGRYPELVSPLRQFRAFGPLHAAALVGNIALIDQLASGGADADGHVNEMGVRDSSPLEAAALGGQIDAVRHLLREHKVSPFGYRDAGTLTRELSGQSRLPAPERHQIEKLLREEGQTYCGRLAGLKDSFKTISDFNNQAQKCSLLKR